MNDSIACFAERRVDFRDGERGKEAGGRWRRGSSVMGMASLDEEVVKWNKYW